jgi:hypothetical protein
VTRVEKLRSPTTPGKALLCGDESSGEPPGRQLKIGQDSEKNPARLRTLKSPCLLIRLDCF